jgi:bifunctional non-homologous end joining protein LigD
MPLALYKKKRDFKASPEPAGSARRGAAGNLYVVQKHDATRLHYDFRLQIGDVLASWAVPKGPSLDPANKRLAVHVEDHPLEYGGFEGTIPKGQYGGGAVMLWDWGTWTAEGADPKRALARGKLSFTLHGEKLRGGWTLTRIRGGRDGDEGHDNWLLIKHADGEAAKGEREDADAVSVKTGRTMEEIAAAKDASWESDRGMAAEARAKGTAKGKSGRAKAAKKGAAPASRVRKRTGDEARVLGVRISNPQRVLYPGAGGAGRAKAGLTKLDIAEYYGKVAGAMLPFVEGRPLSTVRCPQGSTGQCFFQKHLRETFGPPIRAIRVKESEGEEEEYIAVDSEEGIVTLVQFGVLEVHPWGSTKKQLEEPDVLIFDLDPGEGVTFEDVKAATREVKKRLEAAGLETFLKTTGGKGLHVVAPVAPKVGWDEAKAFCEEIARRMAADEPGKYIATLSKAKRRGLIFVDYLRNGRGATAVAPYSTRARAGAPVATPLRWSELSKLESANAFSVDDVVRRLERQREDPWAGFHARKRSLAPAMKAVGMGGAGSRGRR